MIDSFRGRYKCFSNFYLIPDGFVTIAIPDAVELKLPKKVRCKTSEHAFMACKALDPYERLRIARAPTPQLAKKMGRSVALRPDWETIKEEVMHSVLMQKFDRSYTCRNVLLGTGTTHLLEGNTWHDNIWELHLSPKGSVLCPRQEPPWENLMRVRTELREKYNASQP